MLDRKTGQSQLDPAVLDRFMALPFPPDKILAEYVWVDADGNTRSKTRTLPAEKVRVVEDDNKSLMLSRYAVPISYATHRNASLYTRSSFVRITRSGTGQVGGQAPRVEL
jgi:hypothetical protein